MTNTSSKGTLSRRDFLKLGGALVGSSALTGLSTLHTVVYADEGKGLEKNKLNLGIIPLTDCAVLVVALEKGYFKKYGLEVTLSKEASWANIRDKVTIGALDGAHMLAAMPIASTLGVGAVPKPMVTAFNMQLNGNAITVSNALYARMVEMGGKDAMKTSLSTAESLKKVIDADKKAGKQPLTFAMVFPVSTHNYYIRYWMGAVGINPDKDIRLIVIPPPQMVANLRANNIDGYCVGEPWNERAVDMGIGKVATVTHEVWSNHPEKVFGVNAEWAEKYPKTHKAVLMALLEAAQWMDKLENRLEVVKIISQPSYVNAPEEVVKMSMTGTFQYSKEEQPRPMPDFNVFHKYAASFPWHSHATWFITQMIRWGQIEKPLNIKKVAETVYRPDIYQEAAKALGITHPTRNYKTEGFNDKPWTLKEATQPIDMGSDRFCDGMTFDPEKLMEYLAGFKTHSMTMDLKELEKANA